MSSFSILPQLIINYEKFDFQYATNFVTRYESWPNSHFVKTTKKGPITVILCRTTIYPYKMTNLTGVKTCWTDRKYFKKYVINLEFGLLLLPKNHLCSNSTSLWSVTLKWLISLILNKNRGQFSGGLLVHLFAPSDCSYQI